MRKFNSVLLSGKVFADYFYHLFRCAVWDGRTVIAGTGDGQLLIWDLIAVKLVKKIHCHQGVKLLCNRW